jgi:hypothetical protein
MRIAERERNRPQYPGGCVGIVLPALPRQYVTVGAARVRVLRRHPPPPPRDPGREENGPTGANLKFDRLCSHGLGFLSLGLGVSLRVGHHFLDTLLLVQMDTF